MKQLFVIAAFGGVLGCLAAPTGALFEAHAQGAPAAQSARAPTPYDGLPTSQQTALFGKQIANLGGRSNVGDGNVDHAARLHCVGRVNENL